MYAQCRILLIIIIIWSSGLFFSCKSFYNEELFVFTKSPDDKYSVSISGSSPPIVFVLDSSAYLDVKRRGKEEIITRKEIYRGDYFDGNFNAYYPENRWIDNSTLRIGQFRKQENAKINIINSSDSKFCYIIIESGREKLIIFDFDRHSEIQVDFRVLNILSIERLDCFSQKRTGKAIKVFRQQKSTDKINFNVGFGDNDINIESPDIEFVNERCVGVRREKMCD